MDLVIYRTIEPYDIPMPLQKAVQRIETTFDPDSGRFCPFWSIYGTDNCEVTTMLSDWDGEMNAVLHGMRQSTLLALNADVIGILWALPTMAKKVPLDKDELESMRGMDLNHVAQILNDDDRPCSRRRAASISYDVRGQGNWVALLTVEAPEDGCYRITDRDYAFATESDVAQHLDKLTPWQGHFARARRVQNERKEDEED